MRQVIDPQLQFGEQDIAAIERDFKSRDDIPRILRGLQSIDTTPEVREQVFAILAEVLPDRVDAEGKVSADTGRPGMAQWKILVLGALRLGPNADHDRVQELANQHGTLRQMLGHGDWADERRYSLQALKENLRLFTPEILGRINQVVVRAGTGWSKKARTRGSTSAVTPSSSRPTGTIPPTSICCWMRCARPSRSVRRCAGTRD